MPLVPDPWPRRLLAALFVLAGAMHFVAPGAYLAVMPPGYPAPLALVLLSGAAEIAGGLGLLAPQPGFRRAAGWGLLALLVAVYPANVWMAEQGTLAPGWALWLRLPLQGLLAAWVLRASDALGARASERPLPLRTA